MLVKKFGFWISIIFGVVMLTGCATGRSTQADIEALNARVSSLQGQLTAKDDEVTKLQSQLSSQQAAISQSNAEKKMLEEKLDSAIAKLEANSRVKQAKQVQPIDSDLK